MSGHTPGLPSVIHPCPTTAEEQERMRDRAWTDLRNADPTLHAEMVRRWNAHADLVAACEEAIRLTTDHLANDDAPRGLDAATARNLRHICRAAIAKAGGA